MVICCVLFIEVCGLLIVIVGVEGCVNSYFLVCVGFGLWGYIVESIVWYVGIEEYL